MSTTACEPTTNTATRVRAKPDIAVESHCSISLLRPVTDAGRAWIEQNTQDDAQCFFHTLVVEHRYVRDIVNGAPTVPTPM